MEKETKTWGSYKNLLVWNKSIELVVQIYTLTKKYPKDEVFGLISQSRRSAVSIPSNIAEGQSRGTKKDFIHFLNIAYASGAELETQILIAKKVGYISNRDSVLIQEKLNEVLSMLKGLKKSLK